MFPRPLILAGLLGASVGAPYFLSDSESSQKGWQGFWPFSSTESSATDPARPAPIANRSQASVPTHLNGPGKFIYNSRAPLEGMPFPRLSEVLRMDITKEWIYQRWARKSTGLADPELFGIRVPLVTGTGMSDLAGSLSYYFNAQGQVQHISFRGRTGDTTQLIQLLTSRYRLKQMPAAPGEQLYQVLRRGRVQSELRTRPEAILWSTSPHNSFLVSLELERPGSNRTLPQRSLPLKIPKVAPAQVQRPPQNREHIAPRVPPEEAAKIAGNAKGKPEKESKSYWDRVRHATGDERGQVLWKRWPN